MFRLSILALATAAMPTTGAFAAAVLVPYSGSFDESSVSAEGGLPAGDYDTIGGAPDVGLFELVVGANTFAGSIFAPGDTSDAFLIGIGPNQRLIGASISWAENLPGIELAFPPPAGYLQQSTYGANAPDWFLEESDSTPEVFTVLDLEAGSTATSFDILPNAYSAPAFSREQGIYSVLLRDDGGTCGLTYVPSEQFLSPECVAGLDYTMTFQVEAIGPTPSAVPLPAAAWLLLGGLAGLAAMPGRRTASIPARVA
jgi:hypothetical protein